MKTRRATIYSLFIMAMGFASILLSSCKGKSLEGKIILTLTYGNDQINNNTDVDSWLQESPLQIAVFDPDKPRTELTVISSDFYSAFSPAISFDGSTMLFTAKQKQNDPWQIYEMKLGNSIVTKITNTNEDFINPLYLPGGRLAFGKIPVNDTSKTGQSLYTCKADGSDIKRITFSENSFYASTILKDGRILTFSRQLYPEKQDPAVFVLRPDGTKAELFYMGNEGCSFSGRAWESDNGRLVFIESDKGNQNKKNVISINYNRPLHSAVNLTSDINGDFKTVFPVKSGKLLVTWRQSESDRYSLNEFDPATRKITRSLYSSKENDVFDALMIEKHDRPRKLPSEVDMGVKTGLLLCTDVNLLNQQTAMNTSSLSKASSIRVIGKDSTLGVVEVEEDGSFYLKVIADTPFKIQTIDEKGNVMNDTCGWIWLRPNERRGCVGCHEDPEIVPANRVPLSVKKSPVNVPVHVNKVVEKKVSLE